MNDLKPCPFCGAAADLLPEGQVECSNEDCLVHVMSAAVEGWNRRADGWIACSERMPPEYIPILVYTKDDWILCGHLSADGWYIVPDDYGKVIDNVSHWMPMPEPTEAKR